MYEEFIPQYDSLVAEYKEIVADRFSKADFIEYNEILFSAHSCAIEGNSFFIRSAMVTDVWEGLCQILFFSKWDNHC